MAKTKEILNFLRDKDFTEEELERELNRMVFDEREDAANHSLYQFVSNKRKFVDNREKRLRTEFQFVLQEINEDRNRIKLERAQANYKENRKLKKSLQKQ
jgi:hypothetical protein